MSNQYGPKIVTSGLVLCLDAGNSKSYPGTGTTWNDLSGNNITTTLVNGPTYNSNNKGAIVFDGTNDYAELSSAGAHIPNLAACTLNCFVRFTNFAKSYNIIFETFSTGDSNYQFSCLIRNTGKLAFYVFNTFANQSSYDGVGTYTLSTNTWYMLTFVFQGSSIQRGYVNGLLDFSVSSPVATMVSSSQNGRIGFSPFADRYPSMQLSQLQLYSRAISLSEISQNYNALKGRYGL